MKINVVPSGRKRVVIIGGGFAGLKLARKLAYYNLQVVIIDKNNYHQFQPLFYQVATCGLEPSTIAFPLRKIFHQSKDVHIRIAELSAVETGQSKIITSIGELSYDFLVIATGTDTNFFGNQNIIRHALPMKSLGEALEIRNRLLGNYENALSSEDPAERQACLNIVVVGGGPTGVEVAGTLCEMKKYILPKDYPELNFSKMHIYLVEASPFLLNGMSEKSSKKAKEYLEKMGVIVRVGTGVQDYNGKEVFLANGTSINTKALIWAAGVTGNKINGIPASLLARGNRIKVDCFSRLEGYETIFAIGDIAFMTEEKYPNAHPQVAQVAIQQAECLAKNIKNILTGKPLQPFHFKNKGVMATVGRNRAVVDLPHLHFQGFFAWFVWLFVHLFSIFGAKNRIFIFINWAWSYITYDQSLRLIIRPKGKNS